MMTSTKRACLVVTALSACAIVGASVPASAEPFFGLFSSNGYRSSDTYYRSDNYPSTAYAPRDDARDAAPTRQNSTLAPRLQRQVVDYPSGEAPGTIIIDTPNTHLYLVLGNGKALRYGIGVGREGFTWSGIENISRMAEWPDWIPPADMIARQPYLPRFVAGGPGNPLGARAMYLGNSAYRIHGTNDPSTIGHNVSSGCIRMTNEDVTDLYGRVKLGAKVVVLAGGARTATHSPTRAAPPVVHTSARVAPRAPVATTPAAATTGAGFSDTSFTFGIH